MITTETGDLLLILALLSTGSMPMATLDTDPSILICTCIDRLSELHPEAARLMDNWGGCMQSESEFATAWADAIRVAA